MAQMDSRWRPGMVQNYAQNQRRKPIMGPRPNPLRSMFQTLFGQLGQQDPRITPGPPPEMEGVAMPGPGSGPYEGARDMPMPVPGSAPLDPRPLRHAMPSDRQGGLNWGGQNFDNAQGAVDWMNARGQGTTVGQFLGNHPGVDAGHRNPINDPRNRVRGGEPPHWHSAGRAVGSFLPGLTSKRPVQQDLAMLRQHLLRVRMGQLKQAVPR